jgi:dsDNA-specific endonuclease/ATPase MutS2
MPAVISLRPQNPDMARELLDLHGLKVDEIADRLDRFLRDADAAGLKKVRVMTGKGTGKVKAETIAYLKLARYPWSYEKKGNTTNEGVLVVHLE